MGAITPPPGSGGDDRELLGGDDAPDVSDRALQDLGDSVKGEQGDVRGRHRLFVSYPRLGFLV